MVKSNRLCIIFFQKAEMSIPIPVKLIVAPIIISKQFPCSPAKKIAPPTIIKIIPKTIIIVIILFVSIFVFYLLMTHGYQKVTYGVSFFVKFFSRGQFLYILMHKKSER